MTIDNYLDKPLTAKHGSFIIKKSIDNLGGGDAYFLYDSKDEVFAKVEALTPDGFTWFTVILGHTFRQKIRFSELNAAH
jgi:hypothetical protein